MCIENLPRNEFNFFLNIFFSPEFYERCYLGDLGYSSIRKIPCYYHILIVVQVLYFYSIRLALLVAFNSIKVEELTISSVLLLFTAG
jgi:hypothetical protein